MIKAVGVLESNSIAKGIEAADKMLKTGNVQMLFSSPVCPGKYYSIIHGDVASVENSLQAGTRITGSFFVDEIVIPNVHPMVIHAIAGIPDPYEIEAIGVLEFFSVTGAIYAADAAVKSANVSIVNMRLGIAVGGKSYFTITGDVGAIKSAVDAGIQVGVKHGLMFDHTVIPSPHKDLLSKLV